jgi:class 3 adenylate cyclase
LVIRTGLVIVGDMGGGGYRDPMAIAIEAPNIAARLQGMTEPDTAMMSEAIFDWCGAYSLATALARKSSREFRCQVGVYRVLWESGVQSRCEVTVTASLTPLVGRAEELGLLRRR